MGNNNSSVPLAPGQPLHTLALSFAHPCEAALVKRLQPDACAPHAEKDDAVVLMFFLERVDVLAEFLSGNVPDASFVMVAAAKRGCMPALELARAHVAAMGLVPHAAAAAAVGGHLPALRFLMGWAREWASPDTLSRMAGDAYHAAMRSTNEAGSEGCLAFLGRGSPVRDDTPAWDDLELEEWGGSAAESAIGLTHISRVVPDPREDYAFYGFKAVLPPRYVPIVYAAYSGSERRLRRELLIATGASPTGASPTGVRLPDSIYTITLCAAARHGHLACLEALRKSNLGGGPAEVCARGNHGHVATVASMHGHLDCARWAYEVGLKNQRNCYENAAFREAARGGHRACMDLAYDVAVNAHRPATPMYIRNHFAGAHSAAALQCIHDGYRQLLTPLVQTWRGGPAEDAYQEAFRVSVECFICNETASVEKIHALIKMRDVDVFRTPAVDSMPFAAKFNRLLMLQTLKDVGVLPSGPALVRACRAALKKAGTPAAALLRTWIKEALTAYSSG